MSEPIAVLISDVHYSLKTLELADAAMRQAIDKANSLGVQLIVAGDLHDTKANMRAECMNAMLNTFAMANVQPYVLVGNHDKVHEKSIDNSLNFLGGLAVIVNVPQFHPFLDINLIPYQADLAGFIPAEVSINIVHQGFLGANAGEYIQDRTAVDAGKVQGCRIISGHYHARQTIKLPKKGKWDYIGNPYTLSFAEANDPEKGYQILYEDGSLEFVPTRLRKHVIINAWQNWDKIEHDSYTAAPGDLVWVKFSGKKEFLDAWTKERIAANIGLKGPFRLDLIPDISVFAGDAKASKSLTKEEYFDSLIDTSTGVTQERKEVLKSLWKSL
jgi:DNA repair exonuclease SbcCD nuclease subunit